MSMRVHCEILKTKPSSIQISKNSMQRIVNQCLMMLSKLEVALLSLL